MSGRFPPRIFRRVPFEAELQLRYEPEGAETIARTANVSLGGTFVVTSDPRPPGTTLELSFKLPEQPAPVRGRGRVIWVRERDEGPGRPPGMGVRFLELTPGSREQIFEVVERRVRDGGSPYDTGSEESGGIADRREDTGSPPAVAAAAAEETLGAEPGAGPGEETAFRAAAPAAPEPAAAPRPVAAAETTSRPAPARPAWEPAAEADEPAGRPAPEPSAWEPAARPAPEPSAWEPAAPPAPEPSAWEPAAAPPEPPAPGAPPVEMPEPEGRFNYPVGSAYAGRARGGARGWLIAAGAAVVVAAVAVAGYLLLAGGGTEEIAEAGRRPEPARPSSGGGAAPTGARAARPQGEEAAGPEAGADSESVPPASRPIDAGAVAAASPEEPAPPSEDAAARARRVIRITWQQRDDSTEVVIWGDGRFTPGSYRSSSLGGERPRELIRLAGIVEPFAAGSVEVGTPQVSRVRTGHHVETEPDELHVVVDLAGPGVAASELHADGDRLSLRLEGR